MNSILSKVVLGIVLIFSNSFLNAQVPKQKRKALEELYTKTSGSSWNNTWDLKEEVSSWYGVQVEDGHVVAIKLHHNGLKGELADNFQQLPYLRSLNLAFNELRGQLPTSLFNHSAITIVRLEMNSLSGAMPKEISLDSKLTELSLFNNQLEGGIPSEIGNAKNLKVLNLSSNYLTGSLPQSLSALTELEQLELFGNKLSGEIKLELGHLVHLKELVLSYNNFEGNLPNSAADLEHLQLVQLQGNNFSSIKALRYSKSEGLATFDSDDLIMNSQFNDKNGFSNTRMADTKFDDSEN